MRVLGNGAVPFAVPFTVSFSPVPHSVPQNRGQEGCGKRKSVSFVPFPFFTVPKQTSQKTNAILCSGFPFLRAGVAPVLHMRVHRSSRSRSMHRNILVSVWT